MVSPKNLRLFTPQTRQGRLGGKTVDELLISAGEAARRLGVSPATVQRWVDSGVLSADRTHGGHRRISLGEIRRILAAENDAPAPAHIEKWLDPLLAGDAAALKKQLVAARRKSGNWSDVVEDIASAISEIGRRWQLGSCRIFEEHAASEALRRSAACCCAEMPCNPTAPKAALLTVAGDRHTLGLSLSELIVAEIGWKTLWLGDGPPVEELEALIKTRRPDMLIVAASPAFSKRVISRYQAGLERAAKRGKARLILAGDGQWGPSEFSRRVYRLRELGPVLSRAI